MAPEERQSAVFVKFLFYQMRHYPGFVEMLRACCIRFFVRYHSRGVVVPPPCKLYSLLRLPLSSIWRANVVLKTVRRSRIIFITRVHLPKVWISIYQYPLSIPSSFPSKILFVFHETLAFFKENIRLLHRCQLSLKFSSNLEYFSMLNEILFERTEWNSFKNLCNIFLKIA